MRSTNFSVCAYFACDPMNHAWVKGLEARFEAIPVGQTMKGGIAGRVVASRNDRFAVGDEAG